MPKRDDVFSNRGNLPSLFAKIAELFLRFHLKHHRVRHLEMVREVDAVTTISLSAKGGFFVAAQDLDSARFQVHALAVEPIGFGHGTFLLVQKEDAIDLVTLLCETELAVGERIDGPCAIDGLTVHLHPFSDFLHTEQGGVGQVAIGIGTHVEEEVATLGDDVAKQVDEFVGAFVLVRRDIRP